jgi:hypothetical protein
MELNDFLFRHRGKDVYVLGSGATVDYIDPVFFRDKIVIGVNNAAERLGLYTIGGLNTHVYAHTHYHVDATSLATAHPAHTVFAPLGDQGFQGLPAEADRKRNIVYYPHQPTKYDFNVDDAWPPAGGLIVGSTSTHGAMHLACVMGAANVILVGLDCGFLDGKANHGAYRSGDLVNNDAAMWLARWNEHLGLVANKLRDVYGVRVVSINPFVNLNLEGHTWIRP